MNQGSFFQRFRVEKVLAAWKSGVSQEINNLLIMMTFRPDKDLRWKKGLGKKVHILAKVTNIERKFEIKAKINLAWKRPIFGYTLIQAIEAKLFGFFYTKCLSYNKIFTPWKKSPSQFTASWDKGWAGTMVYLWAQPLHDKWSNVKKKSELDEKGCKSEKLFFF